MKSERTPLDAPTLAGLVKHHTERGAALGITPERSLYDTCMIIGQPDYDVDALYGYPEGTTAAWVASQGLPPLKGDLAAYNAFETLVGKTPTKPKMPTRR